MTRLPDVDPTSLYAQIATMDDRQLLTPGEVATIMRVDPKTVTRWAAAGRLDSVRTLGGHRRYRAGDLKAILAGEPTVSAPEVTS